MSKSGLQWRVFLSLSACFVATGCVVAKKIETLPLPETSDIDITALMQDLEKRQTQSLLDKMTESARRKTPSSQWSLYLDSLARVGGAFWLPQDEVKCHVSRLEDARQNIRCAVGGTETRYYVQVLSDAKKIQALNLTAPTQISRQIRGTARAALVSGLVTEDVDVISRFEPLRVRITRPKANADKVIVLVSDMGPFFPGERVGAQTPLQDMAELLAKNSKAVVLQVQKSMVWKAQTVQEEWFEPLNAVLTWRSQQPAWNTWPLHLMGHGMGGQIAVEFATRGAWAGQVKSVAMLGSSLLPLHQQYFQQIQREVQNTPAYPKGEWERAKVQYEGLEKSLREGRTFGEDFGLLSYRYAKSAWQFTTKNDLYGIKIPILAVTSDKDLKLVNANDEVWLDVTAKNPNIKWKKVANLSHEGAEAGPSKYWDNEIMRDARVSEILLSPVFEFFR